MQIKRCSDTASPDARTSANTKGNGAITIAVEPLARGAGATKREWLQPKELGKHVCVRVHMRMCAYAHVPKIRARLHGCEEKRGYQELDETDLGESAIHLLPVVQSLGAQSIRRAICPRAASHEK